jgi:hypothetical protein
MEGEEWCHVEEGSEGSGGCGAGVTERIVAVVELIQPCGRYSAESESERETNT